MAAITISEQTSVVDDPKSWHKAIEDNVGYQNEQVRVQYFRIKAERVDTPYTGANWWSFNGHPDGSVHSVPDGMPATVLAEAAERFDERAKAFRQ